MLEKVDFKENFDFSRGLARIILLKKSYKKQI